MWQSNTVALFHLSLSKVQLTLVVIPIDSFCVRGRTRITLFKPSFQILDSLLRLYVRRHPIFPGFNLALSKDIHFPPDGLPAYFSDPHFSPWLVKVREVACKQHPRNQTLEWKRICQCIHFPRVDQKSSTWRFCEESAAILMTRVLVIGSHAAWFLENKSVSEYYPNSSCCRSTRLEIVLDVVIWSLRTRKGFSRQRYDGGKKRDWYMRQNRRAEPVTGVANPNSRLPNYPTLYAFL